MNQPNADQAVMIILAMMFDALLIAVTLTLVIVGLILAIMFPCWTPLVAFR